VSCAVRHTQSRKDACAAADDPLRQATFVCAECTAHTDAHFSDLHEYLAHRRKHECNNDEVLAPLVIVNLPELMRQEEL
jgi:hypothetical protein